MKIEHILENLRGVKSFHDNTWDEIITELEKSNITTKGGGFADVITSPNWDYAYKIFQLDSAYTAYLKSCKNNQDNPHIPKIIKGPKQIHSFHKRSHLALNHLYVVKLEKLEEINHDNENIDIVEFVCDFAWEYLYRSNSLDLMLDPFDSSSRTPDYTLEDIFKKYPTYPLKPLLDTIKKINSYCRAELDLNPTNFMERKDGTIVITDPLYIGNEMSNNFSRTPTKAPDDFRTIPPQTKTTTGPTYKK